ncbi:hypothetical protein SAMN03159434_11564 [Enterobacter sp. NFR05]|nr:hypothetical protein SAMN03159434_11564 [Enterobacter sp. NFR05]
MSALFTINTCKSYGCRNLGLAESPDYVWPDYRLGFAALHCRACGSYPPLFNERQFRDWLSARLTEYAIESGLFCPACYQKTSIRYGHNPLGTQRLQCRRCKKVWTPGNVLHEQNTSLTQLVTTPLIVPFQGASADQKLYALFSFDALCGHVVHVSTNFTSHPAGDSLLYQWKGVAEPLSRHEDIIERVNFRAEQFLSRSQFDEIQYASAVQKRNAWGAILRPVIAAHGHFRVLKILFPDVMTHIVAHECFLRGAVITAWSELFRRQQGSLWFIEEEIVDAGCAAPWRARGKTHHGWWQNRWQLWQQGDNLKMTCSLTGGDESLAETLSLTASRHFVHWLHQQPAFLSAGQYSARRVTQSLKALAQQYNAAITATAPDG